MEPTISTPQRDRQMRLLSFFVENWILNNFYLNLFFLYNRYFSQRSTLKWIHFPIPVFQIWQSLEPTTSTLGRDRPRPPLLTGRTGLHDNAASADACRRSVVINAIRIHIWTHFWRIVKNQELDYQSEIFSIREWE